MKIAIAQPNYTIGAMEQNYYKNILLIERAKQSGCNIIVFPEMAISGYPPLDLINDKEFIEQQKYYATKLDEHSTNELGIVYGMILPNPTHIGKPYLNVGMFATNGIGKSVAVKQLLPSYNIFDEDRYFEPGKDICIQEYNGYKFGVLVCEDIWAEENNMYDNNPVEKFFRIGNSVDFLISINASPSEIGKLQIRRNMLSKLSAKYKTTIVYVNQVGANDDIVFDGYSMVYNNGVRQRTAKGFDEWYDEIIIHKNKDGKAGNEVLVNLTGSMLKGDEGFGLSTETGDGEISDIHLCYKQIILGIKDYVNKCGFEKVVIGESGGIDSALTTALAVDALGKDNVIAITMPSEFSSEGSWKDSQTLCDNLGVKLYTHPIKDIYEKYIGMFGQIFIEEDKQMKGLTKENIQARIRGNILMEYSNQFGALVLSTSNKSEASVGFCTIYGDTCGGISILMDIYKTEVWQLSRWYNEKHGKELIPNIIINKEPSAELSPNQKDTDSLPPYQLLDIILKVYIEGNLLDKKEFDNYNKILYNSGVSQKEIKRVLNMVDKAEFKRRQAPPTIRCHKRAFGNGRRLPIVQKFERTI